jgi:DNA-binding NtrC family response regulator
VGQENLKGRLTTVIDELIRRGISLEQARREFERQFIVASIRVHDGNLCQSARSLGVHRNTLRNKVTSLGIGTEEITAPRRQRRFARRAEK